MARHRRKRNPGIFKKIGGSWKPFRGNPFKKHIVRGRRAVKRNIAAGHFDRAGKFHRRKNIAAYYDAQGRFHPIRASTGPDRKTLAKTRYKESKAYAGHHLRKGRKKRKAGKKRRR